MHACTTHTHTNTHTKHTRGGELKIAQFNYLDDFSSVVLYRNAFFQRNVCSDPFRVQKGSKKASKNTFANSRIQRTVYSAQNGSDLCTVLLIWLSFFCQHAMCFWLLSNTARTRVSRRNTTPRMTQALEPLYTLRRPCPARPSANCSQTNKPSNGTKVQISEVHLIDSKYVYAQPVPDLGLGEPDTNSEKWLRKFRNKSSKKLRLRKWSRQKKRAEVKDKTQRQLTMERTAWLKTQNDCVASRHIYFCPTCPISNRPYCCPISCLVP